MFGGGVREGVELGGFIWDAEVSPYAIESCVYRLGPCSLRNPSPTPSRARKGTTWSSSMWSLGVIVALGKESL